MGECLLVMFLLFAIYGIQQVYKFFYLLKLLTVGTFFKKDCALFKLHGMESH